MPIPQIILLILAAVTPSLFGTDLNGKFVNSSKALLDFTSFDAIEFFPDGNCVLTLNEDSLGGSFKVYQDDRLLIEQRGIVNAAKVFKMSIVGEVLVLNQGEKKPELRYLKVPAGDPLQESQLYGLTTFTAEYGEGRMENVATLSSDHSYTLIVRHIWPERQTYTDYLETGFWECDSRIVTYRPQTTTAPWKMKYTRDVVLDVNARGWTLIDAMTGKPHLAPVATEMKLGPPPAGYNLQPPPKKQP